MADGPPGPARAALVPRSPAHCRSYSDYRRGFIIVPSLLLTAPSHLPPPCTAAAAQRLHEGAETL